MTQALSPETALSALRAVVESAAQTRGNARAGPGRSGVSTLARSDSRSRWDTAPMTREEAEAQRERLQGDDHEHTYVVREQPTGECEVVRMNIPHPTHVVPGRGPVSPTTDAEQDADAARRLKALRERRARLADVPSEPADPAPYVVPPPLPGLRGY